MIQRLRNSIDSITRSTITLALSPEGRNAAPARRPVSPGVPWAVPRGKRSEASQGKVRLPCGRAPPARKCLKTGGRDTHRKPKPHDLQRPPDPPAHRPHHESVVERQLADRFTLAPLADLDRLDAGTVRAIATRGGRPVDAALMARLPALEIVATSASATTLSMPPPPPRAACWSPTRPMC